MSWRHSLIGPRTGMVACPVGLPAPTPGETVRLADPGMVLGRARTAGHLPRQAAP